MRTLYVLPNSPWSERARWVLLHHRLEFVEKEHLPMLGELSLRLRTRRFSEQVTVPLLIDVENPVRDSLAIAEYVDAMGGETSLFPGELRGPIRELNDKLEPTLNAVRAALLGAELDHEAALELAPPALRRLPLAAGGVKLGAAFLARKYRTSFDNVEARLREGYHEIRALLGGRPYVHDNFTYADILCATALQGVCPVDDCYIEIGAASRKRWHNAELRHEFGDLIDWRDAIYRAHRPLVGDAPK
jgi:glutathione S-transferase